MKKILHIIVFFVGSFLTAEAQYVPLSSQAFQFASLYNPAFTGVDSYVDFRLGYRYQWAGLDGAPKFLNFSFNTRLRQPLDFTYNTPRSSDITRLRIPRKKLFIHALGINVFNSSVGQVSTAGASVNYAFHYQISQNVKFAGGLSAVLDNTKVNLNKITLNTNPDDYYNQLASQGSSKTILNVRAGALLYSKNFYLGVSYFPLFQKTIQTADLGIDKPFYRGSLQAGIAFAAGTGLVLKPSIMALLQTSNKVAIDYSIKGFIEKKLWIGLSYRDIQSGVLMVGFNINNTFSAAYSYEMSLGKFRQFSDGSHELVLSMKLNNFKRQDSYTW